MKAITPREACNNKDSVIPEVVIEVINKLIVVNLRDNEATIGQDEIVKALVKRGLSRNEIFDEGWLDIEPIYKKVGWEVEYDKPAYNEDYPATFTFTSQESETLMDTCEVRIYQRDKRIGCNNPAEMDNPDFGKELTEEEWWKGIYTYAKRLCKECYERGAQTKKQYEDNGDQ